MKRKLVANSPTWIPLVVNVALIFIAGFIYIYNAVDMPTVKEIEKLVQTNPLLSTVKGATGATGASGAAR